MDPGIEVSTISMATDSPRKNKEEPTTLILPHGSNKHKCMYKEEFHLFWGVVQG
jgi:hypothetical protein